MDERHAWRWSWRPLENFHLRYFNRLLSLQQQIRMTTTYATLISLPVCPWRARGVSVPVLSFEVEECGLSLCYQFERHPTGGEDWADEDTKNKEDSPKFSNWSLFQTKSRPLSVLFIELCSFPENCGYNYCASFLLLVFFCCLLLTKPKLNLVWEERKRQGINWAIRGGSQGLLFSPLVSLPYSFLFTAHGLITRVVVVVVVLVVIVYSRAPLHSGWEEVTTPTHSSVMSKTFVILLLDRILRRAERE